MREVVERAAPQAQPSDGESFDQFFREHYARLGRTMYLLTGDLWEAENLAQDALVKIYEMLGRLTDLPEDLKKK